MIIYYQKSTGKILQTTNNKSKKHLMQDNEKELYEDDLKGELDVMFPQLEGDVDVSLTKEDMNVECGGIWDSVKKETSAPRPQYKLTPEQQTKADRFVELQSKFENQSATLKEVQEYLYMRDSQ